MTVVNIKRNEEFDVYIGRAGHGQAGTWGNPFQSHRSDMPGYCLTRELAVAEYRKWLWAQIRCGAVTLEELAELHGKSLGCFCKPAACHGDVLAAAAAWAHEQLPWLEFSPDAPEDYAWTDSVHTVYRNTADAGWDVPEIAAARHRGRKVSFRGGPLLPE